jgi:hypothetical protein
MPSVEDNIFKFEAFDKSIRSPYVIYADFECLTMPIQKCELSPENSYTSAYQQHAPSGFTMHEVSHRNVAPIEYRGADAVDVFLDSLQTKQEEILALTDEPTVLNARCVDLSKSVPTWMAHLLPDLGCTELSISLPS